MNQEQKRAFKAEYSEKTDLANKLSYSGGVKNILGIRDTKQNIRLKIVNNSAIDKKILLVGEMFKGAYAQKLISSYGLPDGVVFSQLVDDPGYDATVAVSSLNPEQDLNFLASEAYVNPLYFRAVALRSYKAGVPESSNFGNAITHYNINSVDAIIKKDTPLNLSRFETRGDTSTSIMKVDFINEKFPAFMSKNDVIVMQVNASTTLEIELSVGARYSESELFYRQVMGGLDMIHEQFPASCSCDK